VVQHHAQNGDCAKSVNVRAIRTSCISGVQQMPYLPGSPDYFS
jgi:hypothetical protein